MTADLDFSPLFEPLQIRGLTLGNRFVMPGMQRGWCVDGAPPKKLAEYYAARARGGVQLVMSESTAVDHPSATRVAKFGRLTSKTADDWARCVDAVHEAGGHFFMQLFHEGALRPETGDDAWSAYPTLSPSGLMSATATAGQVATTADLEAIKEAFVRSARLTKKMGADGVEVHACHGYLLDQFLWGDVNLRDDGYGGAQIESRARFPAEVVNAIRSEVGPDFVISLRFSQWKLTNYDARVVTTPSELEAMLRILRAAGVDMFHASTRRFWTPEWPDSDLGLAGWTKWLSGLPVIAVGSVGLDVDALESFAGQEHGGGDRQTVIEKNLAELLRRFQRNDFDLVAVGRSSIADPDWVSKVRDGRIDLITSFQIAHLGDIAEEAAAAGTRVS